MRRVCLGNGRRTSQLAFGCGGIAGATSVLQSKRLIAAAWDAGIRHFDVAPSYGMGAAESVLADALAEIGAAEATITTKAGIGRGKTPSAARRVVQALARNALATTPGLRKKLGARVRAAQPRGQFGVEAIRRSVEVSLTELRRDHIDVLLMHELTAADLNDGLITCLAELIAEGKVGEVGVGSRRATMDALVPGLPPLFTVVQTEWALEREPIALAPGQRLNVHGVLRNLPGFVRRTDQLPIGNVSPADALLAMAASDVMGGQVIAQSSDPIRVSKLSLDSVIANTPSILAQLRATQ